MVIWLTGLSGAGKTTIGNLLFKKIKSKKQHTVFLDGDILREVWGDQLGHNIAGRRKNAERISKLCALLDSQGIDVVVCVLSIFPEWLVWNRRNFSGYFEIFLDVPFETVRERDSKGLYSLAREGKLVNVVGIDIPLPLEQTWDLRLSPPEVFMEPGDIAEMIFEELEQE